MPTNSQHDKLDLQPTIAGQLVTEFSQATTTQDNKGQKEHSDNEEIPRIIGRYQIVRVLGKGGMGEVFLAHDTVLDREVAIKFPKFRGPDIAAQRERFRREARSAAALRHVGLCPVYDVGEEQGIDYLTMAYVKGPTLAELIKEHGPLSSQQAAQIVQQVATAMAYAHEHGFVHRDLKPTNIVLDTETETATVLDFGLAKKHYDPQVNEEASRSESITNEGAILGTPAYMPFEQLTGDLSRIGPASDIYSLGLILFELLTGRRAFRDQQELMQSAVRDVKPPSILAVQPNIDPKLEKVYLRACAKLPEDRFSSMAEFSSALAPFTRIKKPHSSRKLLITSFLGFLVVAVLAGIIVFTFTTSEGSVRVEISDSKAPVEIKLDGQIIQLNLDGKPLKVKPGKHQFTVSGNGFETTTTEFTAKAGQTATVKLTVQPLPAAGLIDSPKAKEPNTELLRLTILLEEAQQRNDKPGILRYAREILLHDPDHEEALVTRGVFEFNQNEFEKALIDFNRCLQLYPKNAKALYQRSLLRFKTGHTKEALADVSAVLRMTPGSHDALVHKIWMTGALGRHVEAIELCNQLINNTSKPAEVYWKRASLHYARGDFPAAEEDRKTAITLDAMYRNQFPETLPDPPDWTPGDSKAPEIRVIKSWPTPNNQFTHQVQVNADGTQVAINTDGSGYHLFVIDYMTGSVLYDQSSFSQHKLLFKSNNQLIYSLQKDKSNPDKPIFAGINQINWKTGETERLFNCSTNGNPLALALSEDQKMLAVAGFMIKPQIWDFASKKTVRILDEAEGVVEGAAFTRDNQYLITAAWDDVVKPVRMWDISNGKEIRQFQGHVGGSIHLSLSNKRDRLLTCSLRDRTARLWDVDSGKELKKLNHPTGLVRALISPDGKYALTISGWRHNPDGSLYSLHHNNPFPKIWPKQNDNVLRLWDIESGSVIGRFDGERKHMYSACFAPDGEQAVVAIDRSILYLDIAGAIKQASSKTK